MKNNRAFDLSFIVICALTVCFLGIGVYALPRKSFSEEENRALAMPPKISLRAVASGDFFGQLSSFYSDRIPLRTLMIRTKARCELLLGKSENNEIVFSSDGRLMKREVYSDLSVLEQNVHAANQIKEEHSAFLALVPRSVDVYAGGEESERVCEVAGTLSLLDSLRAVGEGAYYKTDHHLDADGAFEVYRYVMQGLGYTPLSKEAFELTEVCDGFLGSTYSQGGLLTSVSDTVSAWRYDGDTTLAVECLDSSCALHSLYVPEELVNKDKYRYFLGGNHGVLSISSIDAGERERLFIIKDSFANAVIPLLARHFDLTVWDPRYCPTPPEFDPTATRTVVICGIDTLTTTKGFIKPQFFNTKP